MLLLIGPAYQATTGRKKAVEVPGNMISALSTLCSSQYLLTNLTDNIQDKDSPYRIFSSKYFHTRQQKYASSTLFYLGVIKVDRLVTKRISKMTKLILLDSVLQEIFCPDGGPILGPKHVDQKINL